MMGPSLIIFRSGLIVFATAKYANSRDKEGDSRALQTSFISVSENAEVGTPKKTLRKFCSRPGAVADACNPNTLGAKAGGLPELRSLNWPGQHDETPSLLKYKNISQAFVARSCNPSNSGG